MSKPKIAIPDPGHSIDALHQTVAAMKHAIEVSAGQRGPKTNFAVLWQDLVGLGLVAADDTAVGGVPDGWTNWVDYSPAITTGTGALTTVSATGRWKRIGRLVFLTTTVTITTNGTGATSVLATLPLAANSSAVLTGREDGVSKKMLQGLVSGSSLTIQNYDGTYPGANGAKLIVSGCYESVLK